MDRIWISIQSIKFNLRTPLIIITSINIKFCAPIFSSIYIFYVKGKGVTRNNRRGQNVKIILIGIKVEIQKLIKVVK